MEERREKDIVADDITDITLIQVGYYWNSGYNEFDFTCKIKGEDDVLHMREQRHDDGNSLVIRSEKDDIWERISTKEAFKLDDKLQEVWVPSSPSISTTHRRQAPTGFREG